LRRQGQEDEEQTQEEKGRPPWYTRHGACVEEEGDEEACLWFVMKGWETEERSEKMNKSGPSSSCPRPCRGPVAKDEIVPRT